MNLVAGDMDDCRYIYNIFLALTNNIPKNREKLCLLFTCGIVVVTGKSRAVAFAVSSVTSLVARARPALVRAACGASTAVDILKVNSI